MKKKLWALILAAAVVLCPLAVPSASAADSDFVIKNGVLTDYVGPGGDVVIPDSVTSIGDHAFYGCSSLTSVTIPDSVADIGPGAFWDCSKLADVTVPNGLDWKSRLAFCATPWLETQGDLLIEDGVVMAYVGHGGEVVIPEGVTGIGDCAFATYYLPYSDFFHRDVIDGRKAVTRVSLPDSVTRIGYSAFHGCRSLTSINIPEGVRALTGSPGGTSGPFSGCESLAHIELPSTLTYLGQSAFSGCSSLTDLVIPESVAEIGQEAFARCTALTEVVIPKDVTRLGPWAFSGCTGLTRAVIPDNEAEFDNFCWYDNFSDCTSLTDVTIPDRLVPDAVKHGNFKGTPWLKAQGEFVVYDGVLCAYQGEGGDVVVPDGVTEIGPDVFSYNNSLTGVTLPQGATKIGDYAFAGMPLTYLALPDSLAEISYSALFDSWGITDIYYGGDEKQWAALQNGFLDDMPDVTVHFNADVYNTVVKTGAIGDRGELAWKLTDSGKVILAERTAGAIAPTDTVYAARWDGDRFQGVSVVDPDTLTAQVGDGWTDLKLIWVNGAQAPKCAFAQVSAE